MENDRVYGRSWHIDRAIPLALLISITLAGGGGIVTGAWFMSGVTSDVTTLKEQVKVLSTMSERMARLEGKVDGGFAEIKAMIRQPPNERR
jgi:hypothetical protein